MLKLFGNIGQSVTSVSTTSVMNLAERSGSRTWCRRRGRCSSRVLGLYWIHANNASNTDSSDPTWTKVSAQVVVVFPSYILVLLLAYMT